MKITIEGHCAEGKTTISLLIANALRVAGFAVANNDYDVMNTAPHPKLQEQRVKALSTRDDLIIDIETVQTKKEKR